MSNLVQPLFPNGKEKCVTFSYDDGITQDFKLVEIFNRYNLKCTFNLNSGCFGKQAAANGKSFLHPTTHNKIEAEQVKKLYEGHEVAVHTLTHPRLQCLADEAIRYEVLKDKENLEELVGYPVRGMAYPFGTYSDAVLKVLKECGIAYSRTVESTNTFTIPNDFLRWHPTCHFGDDAVNPLVNKFLNYKNENCSEAIWKVFYIWGHSYELDGNETWTQMDELCSKISNLDDTWYATNIEIYDYVKAFYSLIYSENQAIVYNPSDKSIWIQKDNKVTEIKSGETKRI